MYPNNNHIHPYSQPGGGMQFNPFDAHKYSVEQLIYFMQTEGLTLQALNQVRNVAFMDISDFMKMVDAGVCTLDDIKACGVNSNMLRSIEESAMIRQFENDAWNRVKNSNDIDTLKEFLDHYPDGKYKSVAEERVAVLSEESDWQYARSRNNLGAYAVYLEDYPAGKHADEAKQRIHKLEHEEEEITAQLLEDMRLHPWNYPAYTMDALLRGGDSTENASGRDDEDLAPADRFLARGFRLKFSTLIDNSVIPSYFTEKEITSPDFVLPQTSEFDSFPLDRTDVYFIGVPRSGKSTVLGGLFSSMYLEGSWKHIPNLNAQGKDPSNDYYWGLINAIRSRKSPESTSTDTISYISMNVPVRDRKGNQGKAELNFVELSGEAVRSLAESLSTAAGSTTKVWDQLGASVVLRNSNPKILFFLLDYNTIVGNRDSMESLDQERTLKTALQVLTHDGKGKDFSKGCTMSKVESVAILLTKADLMGTDNEEERQRIAMEYLHKNFRSFMNELTECCQRFNINESSDRVPLVFTFSVGKYYVGNTLDFDERDSLRLAESIAQIAPYSKGSKLF